MSITEGLPVAKFHHHHLLQLHRVTRANIHRRSCTRVPVWTAITSHILPPSPRALNTSSPVLYLVWVLVSATTTPNSVPPPATDMTQVNPIHILNNSTLHLHISTPSRPQSCPTITGLRMELKSTPPHNRCVRLNNSHLKLQVLNLPPEALIQGNPLSRSPHLQARTLLCTMLTVSRLLRVLN